MTTIEEIINGRELISWHDLSECFRVARGIGLTFRTIQAWQADKMPYIQDGRCLLFSWPEVWAWYKIHHHRRAAA